MPLLYTEHSLDFDASDDHVEVGDVPELSFDRVDSFSLSIWVKHGVIANACYLAKQLGGVPWTGFSFFAVSGGLYFEMVGTDPNKIVIYTPALGVNNNQWHHIAVTYNGSSLASGVEFYLDGEVITSKTIATNTLSGSSITTAGFKCGALGGTLTNVYGGRLSEASVYNKVLSAGEISTIYNAGSPPDLTSVGPTADLVGYWRLGEHSYPTVPDLSPSGNDGTMTNMAANDIVVDAPRPREAFYSMLFGGTDEYVNVGTFSQYQFERTSPFSVSFWTKTQNIVGGMFIGNLTIGSFRGWELSFWPNGVVGVQLTSNAVTNDIDVRADPSISTGEWTHVVMAYSGSSTAAGVKFYFDGTLVSQTVVRNNLTATMVSTNTLRMMSRSNGTAVTGSTALDEVTVWSKELSAPEVSSLYNGGRPRDATTLGIGSTLVGYWQMGDALSFPTVLDLSASAHNGTATNMEATDVKLDAPGLDFGLPGVLTKSLAFDGSGKRVSALAPLTAFERTDAFTLSAWIKTTDASTQAIWTNNSLGAPLRGIDLLVFSGSLWLSRTNTTITDISYMTSTKVINDGIWHHVVAAVDSSGSGVGVTFYVDGVSVPITHTDDTIVGTIVGSTTASIGARSDGTVPFVGNICGVSVWSKKLVETEVRTLYGARSPTSLMDVSPLANLVAYWPLGEGDTYPTVLDLGPNGYDGTMGGGMVSNDIILDAPAPLTSIYSLDFDGVNDLVNLGTAADLSFERTQPFTACAWVKISPSVSHDGSIVSKLQVGVPWRGWYLGYDSTYHLKFLLTNTNNTNEIFVTSTAAALNTGVWTHVAMSYDGSSSANGVRLYINGSMSAVTITRNNLSATTINAFNAAIGQANGANTTIGVTGLVDEVAVYNRVLAPSEIAVLSAGLAPIDHGAVGQIAALVGWWRMGDPGPSVYPTIADKAAAYNNPGTMTNMDSGDIVADAQILLLTNFLLYSYSLFNTGPGIEPSTETADYYFETFTPVLFFKMRALADPGPGYVTWKASNVPDYAGTFAPTTIQASTAILADSWNVEGPFESSSMTDLLLSTVSSAVTLVNPLYGVLFVGVDTSQVTWNALDVITLPAVPSKGVEVILKDIGGQANTKPITVSGNGNDIDGTPTNLIDSQLGTLHLIFSGTQWSII